MREFETIESLHEQVRAACPSETWTIVEVEWVDPLWESTDDRADSQPPLMWWVYAEPGRRDEPDADKRVAQRQNVKMAKRADALRMLRDRLLERYVVEHLMKEPKP